MDDDVRDEEGQAGQHNSDQHDGHQHVERTAARVLARLLQHEAALQQNDHLALQHQSQSIVAFASVWLENQQRHQIHNLARRYIAWQRNPYPRQRTWQRVRG